MKYQAYKQGYKMIMIMVMKCHRCEMNFALSWYNKGA